MLHPASFAIKMIVDIQILRVRFTKDQVPIYQAEALQYEEHEEHIKECFEKIKETCGQTPHIFFEFILMSRRSSLVYSKRHADIQSSIIVFMHIIDSELGEQIKQQKN